MNTNTKEIDINELLNDFLNRNNERDDLLLDNVNVFYEMSKFINKQMDFEIPKSAVDFSKLSKSTFFYNIELIDDFFKTMKIQFKTDEIVRDGTLEIITTDYEIVMNGINKYIGDHKAITVYNNGYITDSIVWVHEISHYRNQPEGKREQVNCLLTEVVAHAMELIYTDYLENKGYIYEANFGRYDILHSFHAASYKAYILLKIIILYQILGDTSEESYSYLYGKNKHYDELKNEFINIINKGPATMYNAFLYTLSGALSVYMYNQYRKDNNFINNIEELNTSLLNGDDINKCLRIIGITGYNEESLDKIKEAYDIFKKDLDVKTKILLKK